MYPERERIAYKGREYTLNRQGVFRTREQHTMEGQRVKQSWFAAQYQTDIVRLARHLHKNQAISASCRIPSVCYYLLPWWTQVKPKVCVQFSRILRTRLAILNILCVLVQYQKIKWNLEHPCTIDIRYVRTCSSCYSTEGELTDCSLKRREAI